MAEPTPDCPRTDDLLDEALRGTFPASDPIAISPGSELRKGGERPPGESESLTNRVVYEVVQHDGGWAYRVDGVFSETFASHEVARKAAERAAAEQVVPGEPTRILYEDKNGRWHAERVSGDDRPKTDVQG